MSAIIWVQNQVSMDHGKTIMGKQCFEEWIYEQSMIKNEYSHADIGIFQSSGFKEDCLGANKKWCFQQLVRNIRMAKLKWPFEQSCVWPKTFWFVHLYTGLWMEPTICHSGDFAQTPYTYFWMHGGHSRVYGHWSQMCLNDRIIIQILVQVGSSNLLLIHHTWLSFKDNSSVAFNLKSALPRTELQEMDYFGDFTQHVSNYVPNERNADLLNLSTTITLSFVALVLVLRRIII